MGPLSPAFRFYKNIKLALISSHVTIFMHMYTPYALLFTVNFTR